MPLAEYLKHISRFTGPTLLYVAMNMLQKHGRGCSLSYFFARALRRLRINIIGRATVSVSINNVFHYVCPTGLLVGVFEGEENMSAMQRHHDRRTFEENLHVEADGRRRETREILCEDWCRLIHEDIEGKLLIG